MTIDNAARPRSLFEQQGGASRIFSAKVADYVASRPDYPNALFDMLRTECHLGPGSVIADVGSGTGLLAHGLLMRDYRVIGIEPNDEMRAAADRLLAKTGDYRGLAGSAESMPLPDRTIDLVTAAQAFHWFDVTKAKAECLRVLRPQAKVALIWNDRVPADPLHAALDQVFEAYGGAKRDALVAHEQRRELQPFFGSTVAAEYSWPHEQVLDEAGLLSLVFSRSYMPDRSSLAATEAADRVRHIYSRFAAGRGVAIRYTTIAFVGRPQ